MSKTRILVLSLFFLLPFHIHSSLDGKDFTGLEPDAFIGKALPNLSNADYDNARQVTWSYFVRPK